MVRKFCEKIQRKDTRKVNTYREKVRKCVKSYFRKKRH